MYGGVSKGKKLKKELHMGNFSDEVYPGIVIGKEKHFAKEALKSNIMTDDTPLLARTNQNLTK